MLYCKEAPPRAGNSRTARISRVARVSEEFANCANTLCHMVDKMMSTHMAKMAADFKEKGGIRLKGEGQRG